MIRRLGIQLLGMLCLIAQVAVAVAPPGAGVCLRSVAASLTPPIASEDTCCCCCEDHESPIDHGMPTVGGDDEPCPPGCGCCISVPVVDRLNFVSVTPHQDTQVVLAPAIVVSLPPTLEAAPAAWSVPPFWHPPPTFAAALRTVRLLI